MAKQTPRYGPHVFALAANIQDAFADAGTIQNALDALERRHSQIATEFNHMYPGAAEAEIDRREAEICSSANTLDLPAAKPDTASPVVASPFARDRHDCILFTVAPAFAVLDVLVQPIKAGDDEGEWLRYALSEEAVRQLARVQEEIRSARGSKTDDDDFELYDAAAILFGIVFAARGDGDSCPQHDEVLKDRRTCDEMLSWMIFRARQRWPLREELEGVIEARGEQ